jgi:hypothetical protein
MGKAMRKTEISGWMRQSSSKALRLSAVVLGVGILMSTHVARAGDDDDDDKTFEEKIIEGVMRGMGATNMDNSGIDYRERSPLVVPPKIDLPPPASASAAKSVPNWPKDPDEAKRRAAIAARKKDKADHTDASLAARNWASPVAPDQLNVARTKPNADVSSSDSLKPGDPGGSPLSPSQLGFSGSLSSMFHGNASESVPFKEEPTRESLTQPPPGYQTPSSNFAYGTGPKESLNKEYNPAAGKYGE